MREVMHEAGHDLPIPLHRMTWHDAMERYGSDRPDTRFGLGLVDVSSVFAESEVEVFAGALAAGGAIKALNAKGAGDWSRGRIDALNQLAIDSGAKGLAWVAFPSGGGALAGREVLQRGEAPRDDRVTLRRAGDLVCMVADERPCERGTWRPPHAPCRGAEH